jgi:hypothetical protein
MTPLCSLKQGATREISVEIPFELTDANSYEPWRFGELRQAQPRLIPMGNSSAGWCGNLVQAYNILREIRSGSVEEVFPH